MYKFLNITGWRRRGWAALLGVCATAALPPVYALPLLIPAFAGLFLLVNVATTKRQAFLDGWWWGLGYFTTGLYWICISLYVEPEKFAWLTPFALFGLPSILAIYTGLTTLVLHCLRVTCHVSRVTFFAILWVIAEYLRAHLFTGFPWNLIGYVWTVSDVTIQFASVVGVYGLSWLTIVIATMPALFFLKVRVWLANITAVLMLAFILVFGCWRLAAYPTEYTDKKIRVVQANVEQSLKWDPKTQFDGFKKHIDLTRSPGLDSIQIVVWPETAVPYFMEAGSTIAHDLGSILPKDALLITGGLRGEGSEEKWQAWNGLFMINHKGEIVAEYDKHHLVPFGEFIPFRNILPVENISGGHGDFARGPGPATLTAAGILPYSPLICYEAIFPDEATDSAHLASWLLNITNDAWFGYSSGPYQHLEMARMRAVEQGLPLVRAANTGISAIFDPVGRELMRLPLGKSGILDSNQVKSISYITIFSRFPWATILFIIAISVVFLILPPKTSTTP